MILDLVLAFAAGLLSFASTCVLPLVPAYIAYMGGRAIGPQGDGGAHSQTRVVANALLFVAGFTTAFVALGASVGLIGADLKAWRPVLLPIAGAALIAIGVAFLLSRRIPWLMAERRFDVAHRLPRAPWASYVVGLAFAVGWTPCVGPILAAILLRAGSSGTAGQGAILLASYSLGLGVPFLVAAVLSGLLTRAMARVRGAYAALNSVAAVFLIGMGVLIFTNQLTLFNSYLPFVNVTTPFDSAFSAGNPTPAPAGPARVGRPAPAFSLTDTDGRKVSLSDLKGKPVLVAFWATWCGPCRDELPLITTAYRKHQAEGLQVVAVNFGNESKARIVEFWTSMKLEPAPFLDPNARASDAYGVKLGTGNTGLPVYVFVDRQGIVRSFQQSLVMSAPGQPDFLESELKKIL